jgi:hypothetical protein
MSKKLFDQIVASLEESPDNVPSALIATAEAREPDLKYAVRNYCSGSDILNVVKSSIFYEGGLKGKSSRGKTSAHTVHPIPNLAYFIVKATTLIKIPETEERYKDSICAFDEVVEKIEWLKYVAQFYRSLANYKKLEKIKQELVNIKSSLLNKPNPSKLGFRIGKFSRFEVPDRIDLLIDLFEEQVPEAKPFTIGRAIHKLLSQFGIPSSEAAITQRIYRKNKRK